MSNSALLQFKRELRDEYFCIKELFIEPLETERESLISKLAQETCTAPEYLRGRLGQVNILLARFRSYYKEDKPENGPSKEQDNG